MTTTTRLILASRSPRRLALLTALGFDVDVLPSSVDESAIQAENLRAFVMKAAVAKAEDVRGSLPRADDPRLVIAADTMVALGERKLGKPRDRKEARGMLQALSGKTHHVLSGLAVARASEGIWVDAVKTAVTLRPLEESVIDGYVASGAADDKAGAYGIQELGPEYIERVEGDLTNVIGLPLMRLRAALEEFAGDSRLSGVSLRQALFRAYPGVEAMGPALWSGVPN